MLKRTSSAVTSWYWAAAQPPVAARSISPTFFAAPHVPQPERRAPSDRPAAVVGICWVCAYCCGDSICATGRDLGGGGRSARRDAHLVWPVESAATRPVGCDLASVPQRQSHDSLGGYRLRKQPIVDARKRGVVWFAFDRHLNRQLYWHPIRRDVVSEARGDREVSARSHLTGHDPAWQQIRTRLRGRAGPACRNHRGHGHHLSWG